MFGCSVIDKVLLRGDHFFSVHSAADFLTFYAKVAYIRSKQLTAVCWSWEQREEGVKSTCFMSKASQINRSILRPLRRDR